MPPPTTPYHDVLDAWNYYLAHDNHGRGVVLIGHSQGSGVLTELIAKEIDGKPAQARLVSAILMGTALVVPDGKDVGGDFKHVPLCHSASQLGCAIAYRLVPRHHPAAADNSFFGRPREPKRRLAAACVNPANLGGGAGPAEELSPSGASRSPPPARRRTPWPKGKTVTTPFVTVPGLLTAHCVDDRAVHLPRHSRPRRPGRPAARTSPATSSSSAASRPTGACT